jgi:hypothetical protein
MIANLIAAAPQPVDTTEQGPLGFILLTVLCVVFVACLFYMDRIRQRAMDRDDQHK